MRTAWTSWVLLLGIAAAQEPDPAALPREPKAIAAALASTDPRTIAWAAHAARELGDKSLGTALQKALPPLRDEPGPMASCVRLFVFDALLGLGTKVPPADVLPCVDDDYAGDAAFLLLAGSPRTNEPELLELFRRDWPAATEATAPGVRRDPRAQRRTLRCHAIGNLLAAQCTPGFAGFLLEHEPFELSVKVTTPGARVQQSASARVITGRAFPVPEGLPPLVDYELGPAGAGDEVVAPGPIPIAAARRQVTASRQGFWLKKVRIDDPPPSGVPWLQALARQPQSPPSRVAIDFRDAAGYLRELAAAREALREYRARLLQALVQERALGESNAARLRHAPVPVQVDDARTDQATPLPTPPEGR